MHGNLRNELNARVSAGVKSFLALGFGVFLAGSLFFGVEGYFWHLEVQQKAVKREAEAWDPAPFIYGSEYGYEYCPEIVVEHQKTSNGKLVYSVNFSMDKFGQRITPVENRQDRTRFLAFFGCSFTFGQGVNDDETLAAQVAQCAPLYMPYNYALPGYGPQQMLLQTTHHDLRGEIAEKEGMGIYIYIDDHINRAIGSMYHVTRWTRKFPCFEERDGTLAYLGNFEQAHPYRLWVYHLLSHDYILRHYNVNWPISPSIYDMDLTAAIILESAKRFTEVFPGSRFHVVFYPRMSNGYGGEIIRRLREHQIPCLDYRQLFWKTPPKEVQYADTHPTPEGYARVARALVLDLNLSP